MSGLDLGLVRWWWRTEEGGRCRLLLRCWGGVLCLGGGRRLCFVLAFQFPFALQKRDNSTGREIHRERRSARGKEDEVRGKMYIPI